jgi:hypothetical protein
MTAISITSVDQTLNRLVIKGQITLTGNYGGASTHGDTLSFAGFDQIKSNSVPELVQVFENPAAGTAPTGYLFTFCPGTTNANGVLNINNNLTEYAEASAYSAGLLAASIMFRAEVIFGV